MAKYKEKKDWDHTSKIPTRTFASNPRSNLERNVRRKLINLCLGKYILFIKNRELGKCKRVSDGLLAGNGRAFFIECENGVIAYLPDNSSFTVEDIIVFVDRFDSKEDLYSKKLMYEVTDSDTAMDMFAFNYAWGDQNMEEAASMFGLNQLERK